MISEQECFVAHTFLFHVKQDAFHVKRSDRASQCCSGESSARVKPRNSKPGLTTQETSASAVVGSVRCPHTRRHEEMAGDGGGVLRIWSNARA